MSLILSKEGCHKKSIHCLKSCTNFGILGQFQALATERASIGQSHAPTFGTLDQFQAPAFSTLGQFLGQTSACSVMFLSTLGQFPPSFLD
ncbi:hypothetical protein Lalb_Chr22g0351781 [Lupinus albus]|uniref:Uncharacterized protein n=1 Tax=Lupinus albus TaxID=3870 RepID=A0A6A4NNE8_LUPAL|nr:hypothetical protein Lalb_Chr22g0351781 [Lupinus albus]